jgi:hypothetical protein
MDVGREPDQDQERERERERGQALEEACFPRPRSHRNTTQHRNANSLLVVKNVNLWSFLNIQITGRRTCSTTGPCGRAVARVRDSSCSQKRSRKAHRWRQIVWFKPNESLPSRRKQTEGRQRRCRYHPGLRLVRGYPFGFQYTSHHFGDTAIPPADHSGVERLYTPSSYAGRRPGRAYEQ